MSRLAIVSARVITDVAKDEALMNCSKFVNRVASRYGAASLPELYSVRN